ncbi:MAG TPA: FIST N-terminal domain-containing protein [Pirellulales bacterium]|nr:FIST N-terminal domain-containing protein [Pirellulales bacterium]
MTDSTFRCAAALSTFADTAAAVDEVGRQIADRLAGPADLAIAFFSPHHAAHAQQVATELTARLQTKNLLGVTGESIVGGSREVEGEPALSVWAARLPGVDVMPFHLTFQRAEGGTFVGWPDALDAAWPNDAALLLIGDPFTFPADVLLERLGEDRPGLPVLGGMASGGAQPGENRLLLGGQIHRDGAVAVLVSGGIRVRSVVSQGCRPIGKPMVITKAQQNVIIELGGKPALAQLRELFETLPADQQRMVQQGLHVGRVINEYQAGFARGDFLIRNVMGFDPEVGAIAIGDFARVGQTVQFHVRDADSADEDLRQLLAAAKKDGGAPTGALLFTCNGRGTRLFSEPDHDAKTIRDVLGDIPLAGFFAQGEIGPIGGQNFLHGFTAAIALLERQEPVSG